jgi:hypothetical protein
MFVPCRLQQWGVVSAAPKLMAVAMPAPDYAFGRAHINPTANRMTDGINSGDRHETSIGHSVTIRKELKK